MQCFICVTYMIILCSGNPTRLQELDSKNEKFSFVNNFIASLFHKQKVEDVNDNEENQLTHNDDKYGYDNFQLHLNEADFLPRRNDRIAMPPLQYRFPKGIKNESVDKVLKKTKEVIVNISNVSKLLKIGNLRKERARHGNKNKSNYTDNIQDIPEMIPFATSLGGQSQVGDRESQTVVKPTVIVNIRGSINNREETKLDKARGIANDTDISRNIFNINQEINVNSDVSHGKRGNVYLEDVEDGQKTKSNADLLTIICQPNWKDKKNKERKLDVMEILFTV